MIYALYKPYAQQDYGKLNSYLSLYRKIYVSVFAVMLCGGLIMSFFLPSLIRPEEFLADTYLIYYLFLANSVIGYLFAYKRSILLVKEKGYYVTNIQSVTALLLSLTNMLILAYTKSYLLYLCHQILFTILNNVLINYFANKESIAFNAFEPTPLTKEELTGLKENVFGSFLSKIASVAVLGTDNILISTLINLKTVAIYSNYAVLTSLVNALMASLTQPLMASVGGMLHQKNSSKEAALRLFERHTFAIFGCNYVLSLMFLSQVNTFMTLWLGQSFVLPFEVVLLLTANLYLYNSRQTLFLFINAYGLYRYEKVKSILEAVLNLLFSILLVLVFKLGLFGIILGTFLSTLCSPIIIEPIFVFKHGFQLSPLMYWKRTLHYYAFFVVSVMGVLWFNHLIHFPKTWLGFLVGVVSNLMVVFGLLLCFSYRTPYFKAFLAKYKKINVR